MKWKHDFHGVIYKNGYFSLLVDFKLFYVACLLKSGHKKLLHQNELWTERSFLFSLLLVLLIKSFWELT